MSHNVVTETFHAPGGLKTGVLLRRREPSGLRTLVCFVEPDGGLYHVESAIDFHDEVRDWTHCSLHDADGVVDRDHHSGDGVVPSHAEYLLVRELLHSGEPELVFHRLDEGTGEVHPARLVHDHDEVLLYVDERLTNRHRVLGEEVLASDWNGASSRPVESVLEVLQGLDERVVVRARAFLGGLRH